jgi:hypothetical protein
MAAGPGRDGTARPPEVRVLVTRSRAAALARRYFTSAAAATLAAIRVPRHSLPGPGGRPRRPLAPGPGPGPAPESPVERQVLQPRPGPRRRRHAPVWADPSPRSRGGGAPVRRRGPDSDGEGLGQDEQVPHPATPPGIALNLKVQSERDLGVARSFSVPQHAGRH